MGIGEKLAEARKRKGITQEQLANNLPISRESIAKYELGKRSYPEDLRREIAQRVDDVEFYFATWKEAAGDVSIPFFNGDYVDHHPASMNHRVTEETKEALEHLTNICWLKPADALSVDERDNIKRTMNEVLDAASSMINLVAVLSKSHGMSMNDIFKSWQLSLKVRKLKK